MKVITFSRNFPGTHPKKGEETFFVEQIYNSLGVSIWDVPEHMKGLINDFFVMDGERKKYHTIRGGNRWKVGDWFSPRIWSGKPYASKQIQFAPPMRIKKIWEFQFAPDYDRFWIDGVEITNHFALERLASNDGLTFDDLIEWFSGKELFTGQIICWNESIEY